MYKDRTKRRCSAFPFDFVFPISFSGCEFIYFYFLFKKQEAAQQGATEAPPADADVDLHFVAFVPGSDNHLWQLDGRKAGPIDHGETTSESLLRDVAAVIKKNFVEKANSLNFSLVALAAAQEDDF